MLMVTIGIMMELVMMMTMMMKRMVMIDTCAGHDEL